MDLYDPSGLLAIGLRWLSLLGCALLAGALAFNAFVLRSRAFPLECDAALETLRRSTALLARIALCAGALAGVLLLEVHTAAVTGSDAAGALASLPTVLFGTTWGLAWLARMCSLAGIAIVAWRGGSHPVALVLAAILLFSFSQDDHGHTIAGNAAVAADWIHLSCAALWFGGVAALVAGLPAALSAVPKNARSDLVAIVFARFSAIAIPSVTAVIATGIFASVTHGLTFASLLESVYGRIVLAKVVLLLPLIVLGYRHYRFGHAAPARSLVLSLSSQAGLLAVILALSAALTGFAAPHSHT